MFAFRRSRTRLASTGWFTGVITRYPARCRCCSSPHRCRRFRPCRRPWCRSPRSDRPAPSPPPRRGNAGASAQLGANQQPDAASGLACNVTAIGSPSSCSSTCKRPCLIPGYHLRNESQSAVTVGVEPARHGQRRTAHPELSVPPQQSSIPEHGSRRGRRGLIGHREVRPTRRGVEPGDRVDRDDPVDRLRLRQGVGRALAVRIDQPHRAVIHPERDHRACHQPTLPERRRQHTRRQPRRALLRPRHPAPRETSVGVDLDDETRGWTRLRRRLPAGPDPDGSHASAVGGVCEASPIAIPVKVAVSAATMDC